MNFEFAEEQMMLRDQARGLLSDHCPPAVVRRVLDTDELYAADLWRTMAEMGWTATVIPESYGGLGLSYLELSVIAEELGRAAAPVPFSSSVYLATEMLMRLGSKAQKAQWLPKLASGEVIATFAYAEGGGQPRADRLVTTARQDRLSGTKPVVADAQIANLAIVVAASNTGDGASVYLLPLDEDGVILEPIATVDPTRPHAHLVLDGARAERLGKEGH
ncbi:MAG: acyl-CoA dehydrogenase family protein, partial [Pseudomonadota bacterium]